MSVECEVVLKIVKPVKAFVYDNIKDYIGYIKSYEGNLCKLRDNLSDVYNKKDYIIKQVLEGKDEQKEITREADCWLKVVRTLAGDEKLKSLMYEDVETAKFVLRLMGKRDLKKLVRKDGEMQKLVVKVMNKLKEEMEISEDEDRLIATVDYKMVAEVVVEVMKDTTEEFKKLMKKDKKMAVIATRMLIDTDLDKLTKDDIEMEDIVREAGSVSDGDLCQRDADENVEESSGLPVPGVDDNSVREAVSKLLIPLGNLHPIVGELMNDAVFKNALPEAEDVKLGWDVLNGLLLENRAFKKAMDENVRQQESCSCFCAFALSYYRNQYKMSITAETIAKRIENDMIEKCPGIPVTVSIRSFDMKRTPTQFLKGLQSRDRLLQDILKILREDQVHAVGLFGMGGCGKTTLAKEVASMGVDSFCIIVEISESPDIRRIQGTIAESIGLPLQYVQNIGQRAIKLFNRLISEKEKKILIILDNIWKKLNLDDVGIPNTCKLLLTTREKEVCRLMGVRDADIREVGLLNGIEAKGLFKSQVGDKGGREEYKTVTNRLLSKSGGLPLAIVVTANALKDKDLPYWRKFADELEKPISSQLASGGHGAIYSILSSSYRFIESKEKRMFFLLCCMWCFGTHIPKKAVMRYGIGLDLFQHVNKLSEAMDQADRWADELMSSSMLLKSDLHGYLKIHDVVRAFGISFAAKDDGHKLLVDAIPRWMNKKTLREYTTISLFANNDYSRLIGINSNKLQILLLRSTVMLDYHSSFSGTMKNLTVLDLENVNFDPKLPESIGKLLKLRTLSLEYCTLGDIKAIGELVNLSVLSLRDSHLEEFPNEIEKLINLRLLDLTNCICKLRRPDLANILGGLSELEGLFMFNNIFKDGGTGYAPLAIEYNNLHYLNALEMHIWCAEQLSVDAQFVKNLDSFRTCVNYRKGNYSNAPQVGSFLCILDVEEVNMGEISGKETFKALLKKADWLRLRNTSNTSILFDELDDDGLPELRHLEVYSCKDVTFIVNLRGSLLAFPSLHTLALNNLPELNGFFDGEALPGVLSYLQCLSILGLKNLQYVLPSACAPCKLSEIKVGTCESLKFIFSENSSGDERHAEIEETNVMKLPFLKLLDLSYLDHFVSLLGSVNFSGIGDDVQEHQAFFNPRIVFSSLEEFSLSECKRIVKLWDKDLGNSSFQSLRTIKIVGCEELSSLGSFSLFSALVRLESLTIEKCKSMHEVITTEGTEELDVHDQVVIFPQLKDLVIKSSSNLKSFYRGKCKLEFPNLKNLRLSDLDYLDKFADSDNQPVLFHKEIVFSSLEQISLVRCRRILKLWDKELGNSSFRSLRTIKIASCEQLSSVGSLSLFSTLFQLERLTIVACGPIHEVITTEGTEELEECDQVVIFPQLKDLVMGWSSNLKSFYGGRCKLKFPTLKTLSLTHLKCLNKFAGSQNQLVLFHKEMDFPCLEELDVSFVNDEVMGLWDWHLEGGSADFGAATALSFFKHLKNLRLMDLPRLKIVPLRLFKSICTLFLGGLSWDYAFSADTFASFQDSLQHLETLEIMSCKNMGVVIQDDGEGDAGLVFRFPRLKTISLVGSSIIAFSNTVNATLCLPSLERIEISGCDAIQHFWSGPIVVPKLKVVTVKYCITIKSVLVGNPNYVVELPSLIQLWLSKCPAMLFFSSGPLTAPKLTKVCCYSQMQSFSTGYLETANIEYVTGDLMEQDTVFLDHISQYYDAELWS